MARASRDGSVLSIVHGPGGIVQVRGNRHARNWIISGRMRQPNATSEPQSSGTNSIALTTG